MRLWMRSSGRSCWHGVTRTTGSGTSPAGVDPDTGRLPDGVGNQWQTVDAPNTRWLADLVAGRGWAGRTLVGDDGAQAAWLLAQHADHDPDRQRAFVDALRRATAQARPHQRSWRTWRTGSRSTPGKRSSTARSPR